VLLSVGQISYVLLLPRLNISSFHPPQSGELRLEFNELTGTVPQEVCDLNLVDLVTDCGGDPPEIVCTCCTFCVPADDTVGITLV
jgi:hypothetical protein